MTKTVLFLISTTYKLGFPIIAGQKFDEGFNDTTIIKQRRPLFSRRILLENVPDSYTG